MARKQSHRKHEVTVPEAAVAKDEEVTLSLVRELLRLGFSVRQIVNILRNPLSGRAHAFYAANGEGQVLSFIAKVQARVSPAGGM